ncbi:MAG: hypothetical protein R2787_10615 [Saprospiraceae bacterium]
MIHWRTLILALFLTLSLLSVWEVTCRNNGFLPTMDDDKYLWAAQRDRVRDHDSSQVVIIGASRAHFDFQLDDWEDVTGIRPLQLAADGKSPGPVLQDIVNNTAFNGTIVMNITPSLFFIPPADSIGGWKRAADWVDSYHKRTLAQRLNHWLSYGPQSVFAFLTSGEEGDPDLKSMISTLPPKGRVKQGVPFPRFSQVSADRNTWMMPRMETDTAFQRTIQNAWYTFGKNQKRVDKVIEQSFPFYLDLIRRLEARGGRMIFTFNPSSGWYTEFEATNYPRELYYDAFVQQCGCPAYHFQDYPSLARFVPPEWSHLSNPDAREYTRRILAIMQQDGVL